MKILYFHQHFSTPKGSTGNRSYAMAKALIAKGHEVTMVCGLYGGGETGLTGEPVKGKLTGTVDGINIIAFDLPYSNKDGFIKRAMTFLKFAAKSIGIAMTHKYDLVFATTTPLTAGIPGIFARWLRGKPFVFEVRDLWPELPKAMGVITNPLVLWAMGVLEFVSYRSAHHCIGLAPGIVDGIKKRGVKAERVSLIPNGCDIDLFQASADKPLRPEGLSNDKTLAVYTGTHGFANGLHSVLYAAKVLKARGRNDIDIALIGQGVKKEALIEEAKAAELTNLHFYPPVPKTELTRFMAGADCGLQILANVPAFYFGTSPNKFFDYISAGLPVVTNYPGWVAEMVTENDCGKAAVPDDPDALADAIEFIADNKKALPKMGASGLALAKREFDRNALAEKFVSVLEMTAKKS